MPVTTCRDPAGLGALRLHDPRLFVPRCGETAPGSAAVSPRRWGRRAALRRVEPKESMKLRLALALAPTLAILACGTDNGSNVFGPTFGPNEAKDGGSPPASSNGGPGTDAASPGDGDGGTDASDETSSPCATGTVAVLAGNDASLSGSVQSKGGPWSGAAIAGGAALSKPALVPFGAGFLGVVRGTAGALQSTAFATAWTGATSFGNANVKGPPALAVSGTKAHVVYSAGPGPNTDFAHGIHDGTAWNAATATVGAKPSHSFGTVGAGLAAAGTSVVFVENGSDDKLYARTFDGAWGAAAAIPDAMSTGTSLPAPPVVVAAEGAIDLVAVYVQMTTRRLSFATRAAADKTWQDRGVIHMLATTDEPFSATRISQSTFLVAFRGQDGNGYHAQGTLGAGGTIAWTAAQPVGAGGNVSVDSAPAVAKGVCADDAIVVYASGGAIKATRLRGTSWTAPETVTGATGSRVAVATR
jgi:hypothetical protein